MSFQLVGKIAGQLSVAVVVGYCTVVITVITVFVSASSTSSAAQRARHHVREEVEEKKNARATNDAASHARTSRTNVDVQIRAGLAVEVVLRALLVRPRDRIRPIAAVYLGCDAQTSKKSRLPASGDGAACANKNNKTRTNNSNTRASKRLCKSPPGIPGNAEVSLKSPDAATSAARHRKIISLMILFLPTLIALALATGDFKITSTLPGTSSSQLWGDVLL